MSGISSWKPVALAKRLLRSLGIASRAGSSQREEPAQDGPTDDASPSPGSVAGLPKPYYQRAGVTLYLGDCMQILPLLPRNCVDLILVDPPYGMDINLTRRKNPLGKIMGDDGSFDAREAMRLALPALRRKRHVYCFGKFNFTDLPFGSQADLIWDKGNSGVCNPDSAFGQQHEMIQFAVHVPSRSERENGDGARAARLRKGSIFRHGRVGASRQIHPTEKPVSLLREIIESSSQFGEVVLDFCAGSGSTLEAALLEGRQAIGIEIDPKYADLIRQRIDRVADGMNAEPATVTPSVMGAPPVMAERQRSAFSGATETNSEAKPGGSVADEPVAPDTAAPNALPGDLASIQTAARDLGFALAQEVLDSSPTVSWLVEGVWPAGGVGFIAGPEKAFKTMLAVDLAVSVASGSPFLGRYATHATGPVILISVEETPGALAKRVDRLYQLRRVLEQHRQVFVRPRHGFRLDTEAVRQQFRDAIDRLRPRLVILDPLVEISGISNEIAMRQVKELLSYLKDTARDTATAILVVHHTGKQGKSLRGTSYMEGWWRSKIAVERRDDAVLVRVHHTEAPSLPKVLVTLADPEGLPHLEIAEGQKATEPEHLEARIRRALLQHPMPVKRLAAQLKVRKAKVVEVVRALSLGHAPKIRRSGWDLLWVEDEPTIEDVPAGNLMSASPADVN